MYRKKAEGWQKHVDFIVLDLLCLEIAFILAYVLRNNNFHVWSKVTYRTINLVAALLDLGIVFSAGTYKNVLKRHIGEDVQRSLVQVGLMGLGLVAFLFLTKEGGTYSRAALLYFLAIYYCLNFVVRYVHKQIVLHRLKDKLDESIIVVVTREKAESVLENLKNRGIEYKKITGLALVDSEGDLPEAIAEIPVVCRKDQLVDYVCSNWVDEVLLAVSTEEQREKWVLDLTNDLVMTGVTVHTILARVEDLDDGKKMVEKMGKYLVLTTTMKSMTPVEQTIKRLIDIAGALVGSLITIIAMIFVVPILKIQSPGPVFFKQTRVGKNGKPFKIIKFRSMYMDAEERKKDLMEQNKMQGLMFKMDFDPRVIGNYVDANGKQHTGFGEFIRKYSIDELPQFFNVLMGDMSLVGTRPPTMDEYEQYNPRHKARLAIQPGITGMWQVSGRSNITDFEEVVQMDMDYINNWSVWLDIRIILKTIKVVVKRDGAV